MDPSKEAEREAVEDKRMKVTERRGENGWRRDKKYVVRKWKKKLDKAEVPSYEFVTATRWRGKVFFASSPLPAVYEF